MTDELDANAKAMVAVMLGDEITLTCLDPHHFVKDQTYFLNDGRGRHSEYRMCSYDPVNGTVLLRKAKR